MAFRYISIELNESNDEQYNKLKVYKNEKVHFPSICLCFPNADDKPNSPEGFWLKLSNDHKTSNNNNNSNNGKDSIFIKWDDILIEPINNILMLNDTLMMKNQNEFKITILPLQIQFDFNYRSEWINLKDPIEIQLQHDGHYYFRTNTSATISSKPIKIDYKDIEATLDNFNRFYVMQRRYELKRQPVSMSFWSDKFAESVAMLIDRFSSDYHTISQNKDLEITSQALKFIGKLNEKLCKGISLNQTTKNQFGKKIAMLEWIVNALRNMVYEDRYGTVNKYKGSLVNAYSDQNRNFEVKADFSNLDFRQYQRLDFAEDHHEFVKTDLKLDDTETKTTHIIVYDFFNAKVHTIDFKKLNFSENTYRFHLNNGAPRIETLQKKRSQDDNNMTELNKIIKKETKDLPITQKDIDEALYRFCRFYITPMLKAIAKTKENTNYFDSKHYEFSRYQHIGYERSLWNLVEILNDPFQQYSRTTLFLQREIFKRFSEQGSKKVEQFEGYETEYTTRKAFFIMLCKGLQELGKNNDFQFRHNDYAEFTVNGHKIKIINDFNHSYFIENSANANTILLTLVDKQQQVKLFMGDKNKVLALGITENIKLTVFPNNTNYEVKKLLSFDKVDEVKAVENFEKFFVIPLRKTLEGSMTVQSHWHTHTPKKFIDIINHFDMKALDTQNRGFFSRSYNRTTEFFLAKGIKGKYELANADFSPKVRLMLAMDSILCELNEPWNVNQENKTYNIFKGKI